MRFVNPDPTETSFAAMSVSTFTRHCRSELAKVFDGDSIVIDEPVPYVEEAAELDLSRPDYLGLRAHPAVRAAANSSGEARAQLKAELAELLQQAQVLLADNAFDAAFATITALVRPHDHVVIDSRSRSGLLEGARAATKNVHSVARLDADSARELTAELRARDPRAGILMITAGLFASTSELGPIDELSEVAGEHGALLLVDVAHGLSAPSEADLITGSFGETFGAEGGFVATTSVELAETLRYHAAHVFRRNAIDTAAAASILEALRIARSREGEALRARLAKVSQELRAELERNGVYASGDRTPVVVVPVGSETAARRIAWRAAEEHVSVDLVSKPGRPAAVRMFASAAYTREQIAEAARAVAEAIHEAERELREASVLSPRTRAA